MAWLVQLPSPQGLLWHQTRGTLVSVWSILTCLILFLSDPVNVIVCWADSLRVLAWEGTVVKGVGPLRRLCPK